MSRTVLVVEDEEDVRELVCELLEGAGYRAVSAVDGRNGVRAFHEQRPDLVILDLGLPGVTGWEVLARIREMSDTPVLILTASGGELERVRGLREGADDYVVKPFSGAELMARSDAILRRSGEPEYFEAYDDGVLGVDHGRQLAWVDGREVSLTHQEFKLLSAFVRHPNQVLSSGQLLEQAWGGERGRSAEQVKLYVSRLRRKLERGAREDSFDIETVRGAGYRFRPSPRS